MRAVARSHGGPIDCGNLVGGVWEEPMIVGTLSLYSDTHVTLVTVTGHTMPGFPTQRTSSSCPRVRCRTHVTEAYVSLTDSEQSLDSNCKP